MTTIDGVVISWTTPIVVLLTVPVLAGLVYLVQKTKQGKAMRATAQDMNAAAIMGINVNRTISFTFLLAGSLAGAAGLVFALTQTDVRFDQGFTLGLIAFTAAVLGGIGNLPGAVLGAILIGLIQAFNEASHLARARLDLDRVDRVHGPDPDPRLPPRGPPRRADTRRGLSVGGRARRVPQPDACAVAGACPSGSAS